MWLARFMKCWWWFWSWFKIFKFIMLLCGRGRRTIRCQNCGRFNRWSINIYSLRQRTNKNREGYEVGGKNQMFDGSGGEGEDFYGNRRVGQWMRGKKELWIHIDLWRGGLILRYMLMLRLLVTKEGGLEEWWLLWMVIPLLILGGKCHLFWFFLLQYQNIFFNLTSCFICICFQRI